MTKAKIVVLAIFVSLFAIGCTTVDFQGIQAVKDMPSFTVVGEFKKDISDPHLISGLLPLGQPDHDAFRYIQDEISKLSGDAAINVNLKYHVTFMDMVIGSLTGQLYSPRTITISGTVVKFQ